MLQDNTISYLNASLSTNLTWLDNAFGKIQRNVRSEDGKRYPAIYKGTDKDYHNLFPDSKKGNFIYWEVEDGSGYTVQGGMIRTPMKVKLVLWFSWISLFPTDWQSRSIEEVKKLVIDVLKGTNPTNVVKVFNVWEDADNIYKGFDHTQKEQQFLMRPYGGLAFECDIYPQQVCSDESIVPSLPSPPYGSIPFTHSYNEQIWPYEKWLSGTTIKCKTFFFATGNDDLNALTGISDSYHIFRVQMTSSIGTSDNVGGAELQKSGGIYNVFLTTNQVTTYITVWYV